MSSHVMLRACNDAGAAVGWLYIYTRLILSAHLFFALCCYFSNIVRRGLNPSCDPLVHNVDYVCVHLRRHGVACFCIFDSREPSSGGTPSLPRSCAPRRANHCARLQMNCGNSLECRTGNVVAASTSASLTRSSKSWTWQRWRARLAWMQQLPRTRT